MENSIYQLNKKIRNKIEIHSLAMVISGFFFFIVPLFALLDLFIGENNAILNSILIEFLLFFISSFLMVAEKKLDIKIKKLSKNIELNNSNVELSQELLENIFKNKTIKNILKYKSVFEEQFTNNNWLFLLFKVKENNLKLLKNEDIINYINNFDKQSKIKLLNKIINRIEEENLNEYYGVVIELFKEEIENKVINSIKYKHSLLKEKEFKEKSIIIHI